MYATQLAELATDASDHWGPGGWWWIFPLLWFAFWITLIVFIGRNWRRGGRPWGRRAEDVLAELYARGEISEEVYRERRAFLDGNR